MGELAAAVGLDDLAVEQFKCHLPFRFTGSGIGEPVAQVGGEGIEVQVQLYFACGLSRRDGRRVKIVVAGHT